jgi:hypothetical protein
LMSAIARRRPPDFLEILAMSEQSPFNELAVDAAKYLKTLQ